MKLVHTVSEDGVTISAGKHNFFERFLNRPVDFNGTLAEDQAVMLAVADLRAIEDGKPGSVVISSDEIFLTHDAVAAITTNTARALSLPPLPSMTFNTEVSGVVGASNFRLQYHWEREGLREPVQRIGAILRTAHGDFRIPTSIYDAVKFADSDYQNDLVKQWYALAKFRQSLVGDQDDQSDRVALTNFLENLRVQIAKGFSIEPKATEEGLDFEIAAHSETGLDAEELDIPMEEFAQKVREKGSIPAYRLADNSFTVVDADAIPVLDVMASKQLAGADEREAFVKNPGPVISEAVQKHLEKSPQTSDLDDVDYQAIHEEKQAAFVETSGYFARVASIGRYVKPDVSLASESGAVWFPETWSRETQKVLSESTEIELEALHQEIAEAVEEGRREVEFKGEVLPVDDATSNVIMAMIAEKREGVTDNPKNEDSINEKNPAQPVVLQPIENFEQVGFLGSLTPRQVVERSELPSALTSELRDYQQHALAWQQRAWEEGLPGILNADEQGLGKTLQSLAFLGWMQDQMKADPSQSRGPILIVAPVSLLKNWEDEVELHMKKGGLGVPVRLYASGLAAYKRPSTPGKDIEDGEGHLDLSVVTQAVEENRAHKQWIITTYQTLTNYQHSLSKIPFSAVVFDEIQALKNPTTMMAMAAKSIKADFRIGLTGTPVENTIDDIWAVMDQIWPGFLESLSEFRERYQSRSPEPHHLSSLNTRIFDSVDGLPEIGIRRLKEFAAPDLPRKRRFLRPKIMPTVQAVAYDTARMKLSGVKGAWLKALHAIRGTSLHPDPQMVQGFDVASARLIGALEILDDLQKAGERVLIFIEDREMQQRFIALAKLRYSLDAIDLINGNTPALKRADIVKRFQAHKGTNKFNLLVLGPKAAGTGLTLTAANHVIHLSRWWNPAVEEQCNDRVHRIGQTSEVSVHIPMSVHGNWGVTSFDCQLQTLMERKRSLAKQTLFPIGDSSDNELHNLTANISDDEPQSGATLDAVMDSLYAQMGLPKPQKLADATYELP